MTTHLHNLLEAFGSRLYSFDGVLSPIQKAGTTESTVDEAESLAKQAICFDIGEEATLEGIQMLPGALRLPFDVCWFESTQEQRNRSTQLDLQGVLAKQIDPDTIAAWIFVRNRSTKHWTLALTTKVTATGPDAVLRAWPTSHKEQAAGIIRCLWAFLSVLNCVNVRQVEHPPSNALNAARKKKGKPPIYSYRTLVVDLNRTPEASGPTGGTHSSPRVHLRRGHLRQFQAGRWTWVQPHAVGNKSLGVVHKDYAVKRKRPAESAHASPTSADRP